MVAAEVKLPLAPFARFKVSGGPKGPHEHQDHTDDDFWNPFFFFL